MALFFLELTGPFAWYVAAALEAFRHERHRDGLSTPESVAAFAKSLDAFAARECTGLPTVTDIAHLLECRRVDPLLLSIPSAAEVLGLSPRKVRMMVRDGEIRSVKVGSRTLVRRSDLERYAAALPPAPLATRMEVK